MSSAAETYNAFEQMPRDLNGLVIVNPVCTHKDRAKKEANEFVLRGLVDAENVVETLPSQKETEALFKARLSAAAANAHEQSSPNINFVAALTGDGTVNAYGNFALKPENERFRHIPIVNGGFGDANDGRSVTYGREKQRDFWLPGQPIVPIYPLEFTIWSPHLGLIEDNPRKRFGLFYGSVGYSALAGLKINENRNPDSFLDRIGLHRLRDFGALVGALVEARPFQLEDTTIADPTNRSNLRSVHELTFSNSEWMATMHIYPGDPTTRGFKSSEVYGKPSMIARVGSMALGRAKWENSEEDDARVYIISTTDGSDVVWQRDGEDEKIESGSMLRTRSSRKPLMVVAPELARAA